MKMALATVLAVLLMMLFLPYEALLDRTEFAPGFTMNGYKKVYVGMSVEEVERAIGVPLEYRATNPADNGLVVLKQTTISHLLGRVGPHFHGLYSLPKKRGTGRSCVYVQIFFRDGKVTEKRKEAWFYLSKKVNPTYVQSVP